MKDPADLAVGVAPAGFEAGAAADEEVGEPGPGVVTHAAKIRSACVVAAGSLWRNRDFMLLQAGRLLSNVGSQSSGIAFPLLVLAVTRSPAAAGIVGFVRAVPRVLFAPAGGLMADPLRRRRLMIATDLVRLVVMGLLAAMIWVGSAPFWVIASVAFVEGAASALFAPAQAGALRAVVPAPQLPAASSAESGRQAVVQVVGPPLGGALFGVFRALPFLVDAISYLLSTGSLAAMRTPFEQPRQRDRQPWRNQLHEGIAFLWQQPFLRTTTLLFGLANFIVPGLLLALVVVGRRQGLSPGAVSLLVAAFGVAVLVGSVLSPLVRRRLPPWAVVTAEFWGWTGAALFLVWPSAYGLLVGMLPAALVIASTDGVVHGYRIAMTPDRLLGRSESVRTFIAGAMAPFGPLVAGFLLEVSFRVTMAVFAAAALILALAATSSSAIRGVERVVDPA